MSSARAAREPGHRNKSHFCRLSRDRKRYKLYASSMLWVKPWRGFRFRMYRSESGISQSDRICSLFTVQKKRTPPAKRAATL